MDYQKQAVDFLIKTNSTLEFKWIEKNHYFTEDKQNKHKRDIFECTLKRENRKFVFKFGQSLKDSAGLNFIEPTAYDVLSCLQKYEVGTFDDFCEEFGYNEMPLSKYKEVRKIYDGVVNEYNKLMSLYNDEKMELLREIQ